MRLLRSSKYLPLRRNRTMGFYKHKSVQGSPRPVPHFGIRSASSHPIQVEQHLIEVSYLETYQFLNKHTIHIHLIYICL